MAVKKAAKKPVKKTAASPAKRPAKKQVQEGERYQCSVCGLAVTVDEVCGCIDACDILCCETPMKAKRKRA